MAFPEEAEANKDLVKDMEHLIKEIERALNRSFGHLIEATEANNDVISDVLLLCKVIILLLAVQMLLNSIPTFRALVKKIFKYYQRKNQADSSVDVESLD